MRKKLLCIAVCLLISNPLYALDLYKVYLDSHKDAQALSLLKAEPLLRITDGYLMLFDENLKESLINSNLKFELIATNVVRNKIAMDISKDDSNIGRYPVLYEDEETLLFQVDIKDISKTVKTPSLAPLKTENIPIYYKTPNLFYLDKSAYPADVDTVISKILQDSLESYALILESLGNRDAGTSGNMISRNWIKDKFIEFGYTDIDFDNFVEEIHGENIINYNVVATKIGSKFPHHQIVIGAHRDAVNGSPGADDNGSGTNAVLEIARIFAELDNRLTIKFILFDAEEHGLYGSWHYANEAYARGDSIVLMINMDMIAHYENDSQVYISYNDDISFADIWYDLGVNNSTINLTGEIEYTSGNGGSDHSPFIQNGYNSIYLHEYIFSNVYHSYRDSTSYMNFDYYTKIVKGTMGTAYIVDQIADPLPIWITFPENTQDYLLPEIANTFEINVEMMGENYIVDNGVLLNYSIDQGPTETIILNNTENFTYANDFPIMDCFNSVSYFISIEDNLENIYYYPDPSEPLKLAVGTSSSTYFYDDFSTDQGWLVTNAAANGFWERGELTSSYLDSRPSRDVDGSDYIYLTDFSTMADVDLGSTFLKSPTMFTQGDNAIVEFSVWYQNNRVITNEVPNEDIFEIFLVQGSNWILLDSLGPVENASGNWINYNFWVKDFVPDINSFNIAFKASDFNNDSHVEAAVDAFKVSLISCNPKIRTEFVPDWTINIPISIQLEAIGGEGLLSWVEQYNTLAGTGLSLSTTGLLSGIPTVSGEVVLIARVIDENNDYHQRQFQFYINDAMTIAYDTIPEAFMHNPYSYQLQCSGGTAPLNWLDKNNDLINIGLNFNSDGLITGPPTDTGLFTFTVQITDNAAAVCEKELSLTVKIDYICGDVNFDHLPVGISDLTYLVDYLFGGGEPPPYENSADVNNSGDIGISDVTYIVDYMFNYGPAPICE